MKLSWYHIPLFIIGCLIGDFIYDGCVKPVINRESAKSGLMDTANMRFVDSARSGVVNIGNLNQSFFSKDTITCYNNFSWSKRMSGDSYWVNDKFGRIRVLAYKDGKVIGEVDDVTKAVFRNKDLDSMVIRQTR